MPHMNWVCKDGKTSLHWRFEDSSRLWVARETALLLCPHTQTSERFSWHGHIFGNFYWPGEKLFLPNWLIRLRNAKQKRNQRKKNARKHTEHHFFCFLLLRFAPCSRFGWGRSIWGDNNNSSKVTHLGSLRFQLPENNITWVSSLRGFFSQTFFFLPE